MQQNSPTKIVFIENVLWSSEIALTDDTLLKKYKMDEGNINVELPHIDYDQGKPSELFEEFKKLGNVKETVAGSAFQVANSFKQNMNKMNQEFDLNYLASIGNDENGQKIVDEFKNKGFKDHFFKSDQSATGRLAVMAKDSKTTLFADLAAAKDITEQFMTENLQVLNGSRLIYTSGFFISSCAEGLKGVHEQAKQQGIPFCFNIADHVLLMFYKETFEQLISYSDFLFASEEEINTWNKIQGQDKDAKVVCDDFISYGDKSRVVIITKHVSSGGKARGSVLIGRKDASGQNQVTEHQMKELQKDAVNSYGVSEAFIGGFLSQMVLMDKNQITEENIFKCINTAEEVSAEVRTTNPFGQ